FASATSSIDTPPALTARLRRSYSRQTGAKDSRRQPQTNAPAGALAATRNACGDHPTRRPRPGGGQPPGRDCDPFADPVRGSVGPAPGRRWAIREVALVQRAYVDNIAAAALERQRKRAAARSARDDSCEPAVLLRVAEVPPALVQQLLL